MSVVRLIAGIPNLVAGPSPIARSPWHGTQLIWKYFLPLASEESLAAVGLRKEAIESIVAGNAPYETWNPATAVPVVGTENCGFPRDGVSVSFTGSHVHSDG